jgi:hypothetical protein
MKLNPLYYFVILQVVLQICLVIPQLEPGRIVFRTGAFLFSIYLLVALPGKSQKHPSWIMLYFCLFFMLTSFIHPESNTPIAGIASIVFNVAIASPIFWVGRSRPTPKIAQNVIMILFAFHTLSCIFGVLQVIYPGQFQMNVSSVVVGNRLAYEGSKIELTDGSVTLRPMGLTDVPGGAATSGINSTILGVGILLSTKSFRLRILVHLAIAIAFFCIYLTQVRVAIVVLLIVFCVTTLLLMAMGRRRILVEFAIVIPILVLTSFVAAEFFGGESMANRVMTLFEDDPTNVYQKNRGGFLEYTMGPLMGEYPFGAGLGRWGMMRTYFGDENMQTSPSIWVEIQFTAWLLDGGLPLMLSYMLAIILALIQAFKILMKSKNEWLSGWAILIIAYNISIIGLSFSYVPFIGQTGMDFWLLNGMLFAVAENTALINSPEK